MAISITVLLGWQFNIALLKSGFPFITATMKANTAICFLLAGISLVLLQRQRLTRSLYRVYQGLAGAIVAIGLLTLGEYCFGWNLHIDQLLFQDVVSSSNPYAGRMGINTAFNFVLMGVALLLLGRSSQKSIWWAQIYSTVAALVALLSLFGYLFNVNVFEQLVIVTTTQSLNTIFSFFILYVGILWLRPDEGFMQVLTSPLVGGEMSRKLLAWAIIIPFGVNLLIFNGQKLGWYSIEFGNTMRSVIVVTVLSILIWWTARSLNQVDHKRQQTEDQLKALNETLEMLVAERTESLQKSQALFAGILEIANDAIISVDSNQQITLFNQGAEKIFGYKSEEAIGQPLNLLLPEQFRSSHNQHIQRFAQSSGKARTMGDRSEILGRRRDGTEFPAEASISKLQIGNETIFTVMLRDISDRKQAERSLAHMAAIVEYSGDGIISKSLDSIILSWNNAAEKIFGYTSEEIIGQSITKLIPPNQIYEESQIIETIKQGQTIESYETVRVRKDGKLINISSTISPLKDTRGKIIGASIIKRDITDRKLAEKERQQIEISLRNSEEQFRHAFEDASIGMAIVSLDGHFLKVNPVLCQIVGYSSEELLGLTFQSITHPHDLELDLSYVKQLLAGTLSTYQMEKRYFHKQGHIVWILLNGSLVQDDHGNPLHFIAQIQDITARKEAQKTIELQSIIMNNMAGGVCLVKASDLTLVYTNPKFDAMFGYAEGELVGQPVGVINYIAANVTPSETVADVVTQLDRDGEAKYEVYNKKKDGTLFWCRAYTSRFDHPEYGSVYVAVQEDVTELKLAEQAMRESEERLQLALEASGDGLWDWNMKGESYLSPRYQEMLGYKAGELVLDVQVWDKMLHPDERDWVMDNLNNYLKDSSRHYAFDYRLKTKSGEWKWIANYGKVFAWDDQGKPVRLIGTHRDISDRKQVELELQQAKEAAEAANLAKSMFLSNMSHELRTPLNAILGFTELMSYDPSLSPKHQEDLTIINRSGKHLLELINDILDLSKIESGQMKLNLSDFDLESLLGSIESLFQIQAQEKDLKLTIECDRNLPKFIHTDQKKLYQTLVNLLANAIKFTKQGSVTLRVRQIGNDLNQCQLLFEVEDTGAGIAPKEIDSLFKPFVQAQAGNKLNQGTGLGLAISQRFIQLMGGQIQVQSTLNQGSTFSFEIGVQIPQVTVLVSESANHRVIGLVSGQPTYRILVVEDIADNRRLLIEILTAIGFEVKEATNGVEALCLWENWNPHLIFMDLRMPVMDGFTTIKLIREKPQSQDTIIIALTASVFNEEKDQVLKIGCDDFIGKPCQQKELFDKIAQHLGVKYIYKELGIPPKKSSDETLSVEALSVMSPQWLEQMYQAAYYLDTDVMTELIAQIPESEARLSKALTVTINNFNSDRIMELIKPLLPKPV